MQISAALVKELRERTGSGMMECKKALVEVGGDIEAAVELMRKAGLAKADKKAGRVAAEGAVVLKVAADGRSAVLVEVNSETDFVAKGDDFQVFADQLAECVLAVVPADLESLSAAPMAGPGSASVEERRRELVAKIGENISVRRFRHMATESGLLAGYLHGSRIGVLVHLEGGDAGLGKDIAMHVAASRPVCVAESDLPAELVEKEREIFTAQAQDSGKPADIIAKMVEGKVKKFMKEVTLLGQPFVKDPDTAVGKLLDQNKARVVEFVRFEVGEGIEKKADNFAEEVMAQAGAKA